MAGMGNTSDEILLYSITEAAKILRVSKSLVYKMTQRREIDCVRIRGRVLVSSAVIRQIIANGVPKN